MMGLLEDITARIDNQTLVELTQRRDNSATTVDTGFLTIVADDVEGLIEVEMGVEYAAENLADRDKKFQRAMATQGVLILLEMYASAEGNKIQGRYDRWIEALRTRRRRAPVNPDSNARADVTPDRADEPPTFDKGYMEKHFKPRPHGVSSPRVG